MARKNPYLSTLQWQEHHLSVYFAMARKIIFLSTWQWLKNLYLSTWQWQKKLYLSTMARKKHICLIINDKKKYMSFYLQWQEKLYFCLLGNGKKPIYLSMASFLSFLKGLFSCTKKIKFLSLNKYYY